MEANMFRNFFLSGIGLAAVGLTLFTPASGEAHYRHRWHVAVAPAVVVPAYRPVPVYTPVYPVYPAPAVVTAYPPVVVRPPVVVVPRPYPPAYVPGPRVYLAPY
jgi:hypothetical protein